MRTGPKRARLVVLAAALSAALTMICLGGDAGSSRASGRLAPDFTLTSTSRGDTLTLSESSGQPILLVFYDAGDMPSRHAMPYVAEWHRRYAGDGLEVIGIHSSEFEPMRILYNALEAGGSAGVTFPVGMDFDRTVYGAYGIKTLPTYFVLKPGLEVVLETSEIKPYKEVETAIQSVLAEIKPGIVNPFLVKPLRPADDPANKILRGTSRVVLGYQAGTIADCDSADYDKFINYTDSGGREKGKVYLQGYWKVGPNCISHERKYGSSNDHLRIIYSGKDVWLLPWFAYDTFQRVYVKQDRVYLDYAEWGKDMTGDETGKPYVYIRYSVPANVVSNRTFGMHELELMPVDGDVAFCMLFFDDGVAE
ncbi:MAG: TlpA disulfide reductase family protein [bacterium]